MQKELTVVGFKELKMHLKIQNLHTLYMIILIQIDW